MKRTTPDLSKIDEYSHKPGEAMNKLNLSARNLEARLPSRGSIDGGCERQSFLQHRGDGSKENPIIIDDEDSELDYSHASNDSDKENCEPKQANDELDEYESDDGFINDDSEDDFIVDDDESGDLDDSDYDSFNRTVKNISSGTRRYRIIDDGSSEDDGESFKTDQHNDGNKSASNGVTSKKPRL